MIYTNYSQNYKSVDNNISCKDGCCKLLIQPFRYYKNNIFLKKYRQKAGALIFDEKLDKILLVQLICSHQQNAV